MAKVEIRNQKISDAKRFYEILNNPHFVFFRVGPKNIEEEKIFLRQNANKRKKNIAHNYSILYNGKLIGGCGININQHRKYIGEIGYFIDEKYWSRGITTKAVKILEKIGFHKLDLKRIEIVMDIKNIASRQVAIKCGYRKEGLMKKAIKNRGKFRDAYLYAKVIN